MLLTNQVAKIFWSAILKKELMYHFEKFISGIKFNYKQYNKKLQHGGKSIRWYHCIDFLPPC